MDISGATGVVVLIGTPIIQVKMPGVMNRYFADQGLDTVLIPMDIAPDCIQSFVDTARRWHNLRGIVITVPYKQVMAPLADRLTRLLRRDVLDAYRRMVAAARAEVPEIAADPELLFDLAADPDHLIHLAVHHFAQSPGQRD